MMSRGNAGLRSLRTREDASESKPGAVPKVGGKQIVSVEIYGPKAEEYLLSKIIFFEQNPAKLVQQKQPQNSMPILTT